MNPRAELWQGRLDKPMIVAALLVIPAILLDAGHFGPGWTTIGNILNWGTWLAFVAEIVVMLAVVDDRREWLKTHPVEVVSTVLSPPVLPGPLQSIRLLRLTRLLRLVRSAGVLRRATTPAGVRDAGLLTVFLVLAGGVAFSDVETNRHLPAWDGVWWAVSTVTTVGYGDISPHTTAGRIIAMIVMVAGIGFLALLTAATAHRFIREARRDDVDDSEMEARLGRRIDELAGELSAVRAVVEQIDDRISTLGDSQPP